MPRLTHGATVWRPLLRLSASPGINFEIYDALHQGPDRVNSQLWNSCCPTLSPEKRRKDGATQSSAGLRGGVRFVLSHPFRKGRGKDGARRSVLGGGGLVEVCAVPPFRQKKGERMGHGRFFFKRSKNQQLCRQKLRSVSHGSIVYNF